MMSEKRFTWKTEKLQHLDDEVIIVVDNANKEWKGHILNIVDKLNELNDERMMYKTTIDKKIVELQEENEQLTKEIDNQAEIIRGQDSELYRLYKLCFKMSGLLKEFGVYDVFNRTE